MHNSELIVKDTIITDVITFIVMHMERQEEFSFNNYERPDTKGFMLLQRKT